MPTVAVRTFNKTKETIKRTINSFPSLEYAKKMAKLFLDKIPDNISLPTPMVFSNTEIGFFWNEKSLYIEVTFQDNMATIFTKDEEMNFANYLLVDLEDERAKTQIISGLAPLLYI